ncbi:unnamed protein product [Zymoseptoria tritici ST99CH_1A5]|uniref:Uncharacterized protein n=3 Tax=Zymoseptoria tritici TaxID=1047171 RepID=A0A1X7RZF9_ZYMT9|nr:unnamed protein product [Zymoseptoria tritici ST99CH_3D7]SMR55491.1 unnamed protein product [Zymoseptoria tritici ST99CH_1E4]SMR57865.1 unnamed protein product [Zymoseptoria tritici ST99CH_3D1]SMY26301.1 unnamed protein product [Zymoseptoria tritici ST99CH_1A5]
MDSKKEGKKPCRDAPSTSRANGSTPSSRAPPESTVGPPRDRRHLEEARRQRKEEDDAREQERIKRHERQEGRAAGAEAGESSKEQDQVRLAVEQSLTESGMQQLHLRGSPGPSTQRAPAAGGSIENAKQRIQTEQAKRQSREAYALETSRAGEPPVKQKLPQHAVSQSTQSSVSKPATATIRGSAATITRFDMPPPPSTVRKPAPLSTTHETTRASPQPTVQPLNTESQQHLDRIRDRLNNPAPQVPPPTPPATSRGINQVQRGIAQTDLPPRNQRLPEVGRIRAIDSGPQPAPPANTQNLRATQEQLALYQREQRELHQRGQQQAQIPMDQAPSLPGTNMSSVRIGSMGGAPQSSTRAPTVSQRKAMTSQSQAGTTAKPATSRSKPPTNTVAKPSAAGLRAPQTDLKLQSSKTGAKPPTQLSKPSGTTTKAQASSGKPQPVMGSRTQASPSKTLATPSNGPAASSGPRTVLRSQLDPAATGSQAVTSSTRVNRAGLSSAPRPQASAPRTVIGRNVSQALTRILVPDEGNNVNSQRPAGTLSLNATVAALPRAPEILPDTASQMITAQIQGTAVYPGINSGGATRRAAESRGPAAVREFESVLRRGLLGLCPAGYQWYNTHGGYICGGGHHFVLHASIDTWANNFMLFPGMHAANIMHPFDLHTLAVHPPPVNPMEPVHFYHRTFMMQMAAGGVVVDSAEICPCIREFGFDIRSPAEVEALENIRPTVRKVFDGTGLIFDVFM